MQTTIDYTSVGRFFISLGILLIVSSFVIYLYGLNLIGQIIPLASLDGGRFLNNLLFLAMGLLVTGAIPFLYGIKRFAKDNSMDESLKFESKIKDILDQDLKFIELKFKTLEYNERVMEYNKKYGKDVPTIQHRDFDSIAKQAMNPKFYEDTYKLCKVKKKS
jgi:hypothetical protein